MVFHEQKTCEDRDRPAFLDERKVRWASTLEDVKPPTVHSAGATLRSAGSMRGDDTDWHQGYDEDIRMDRFEPSYDDHTLREDEDLETMNSINRRWRKGAFDARKTDDVGQVMKKLKEELKRGKNILKCPFHKNILSKPKKCEIKLVDDEWIVWGKKNKKVNVSDVEKCDIGLASDAFTKFWDSIKRSGHEWDHCVSLYTPERTIDLICESREEAWILKELVEDLRSQAHASSKCEANVSMTNENLEDDLYEDNTDTSAPNTPMFKFLRSSTTPSPYSSRTSSPYSSRTSSPHSSPSLSARSSLTSSPAFREEYLGPASIPVPSRASLSYSTKSRGSLAGAQIMGRRKSQYSRSESSKSRCSEYEDDLYDLVLPSETALSEYSTDNERYSSSSDVMKKIDHSRRDEQRRLSASTEVFL